MEKSQPATTLVDRVQPLNIVLGLWILASTYFLQAVLYDGARITNSLLGPFILGVAIMQLSLDLKIRWVPLANVLMGAFVAIAPFVLGFSAHAAITMSNVVAGGLVALIALAAAVRN